MKLSLELEFPEEQAASVLRLLQSVPGITARFLQHTELATPSTTVPPLTEAEQHRLIHELFGSWQSEESGEELARQIQEARYFREREIDL